MTGHVAEVEEINGHPLTERMRRPNPYIGDVHLIQATALSYLVSGNAYWLKARNGRGVPGEFWWVPHWTVRPKWPDDGSAFVTHYEYRPGGNRSGMPIRLPRSK